MSKASEYAAKVAFHRSSIEKAQIAIDLENGMAWISDNGDLQISTSYLNPKNALKLARYILENFE